MNKIVNKYVLGAIVGGCGTMAVAQNQQPNIIVFLVDDMGAMDTSVPFIVDNQGNPMPQPLNSWYRTPNMEKLANQGVRFSSFYAQSVSSPSRTSLMTGQNAAHHRTTNWINAESNNRDKFGPHDWNWKGLTKQDCTYPRLLQKAGYKTIHVGKAHFGCDYSEGKDPHNIGFDVNIAGSSIGHPGSYLGEDGYGHIKGQKARAVPDLEKYHNTSTFLSEALTIEACNEIEKAVKDEQPFYLNMAHYAVHAPFMTDKRFIDNYSDTSKLMKFMECFDENTRDANGELAKNRKINIKRAKAFATLIEGMDKSLGDILTKLDEVGVAENTLIFFLGDNGGDAPLGGDIDYGSCAPLKGKKGAAYEGGVRVPCIIAWAKNSNNSQIQEDFPIAKNAIQNQIGTVMDFYPTILDVANIEIPQNLDLDGSSLRKLLSGKSDKKHRDDFLMHFPHQHRSSYFTYYRKGDWKLIYFYNPQNPTKPSVELYNLKDDPFEKTDLAKENKKMVKKLYKLMTKRLEKESALYPEDKDGNPIHPNLDLVQPL